MARKPYDLGLVVGRFQHIHVGHEHMIDTALKVCDRVLVMVGSAQEVGTARNPFNIATRIEMIQEIYESRVIVKALPDMTHEDDITPEWGRYVLQQVEQACYKVPEVMVYGNDEARSNWFDPEDIKTITEVIVSRANIVMSATTMRDFLARDMRNQWMKHANPSIHKHYDRLRAELLHTQAYKQQSDMFTQKG